MKFLVDECTGLSGVRCLREEGHDATAVSQVMPQAADEDVLRRAAAEGRILVTNDKDFGEMVFRSGEAHAGIVLLRLRDERAATKTWVMREVLKRVGEGLQDSYVVASEMAIRVRR